MELSGKGNAAKAGNEGEHIARQLDTTGHQRQHICQKQQVYNGLEEPEAVVFPFQEAPSPSGIQNVVSDETYKHRRTYPLVGELPGDLIGHQDKQQKGHADVKGNFALLFPFHGWNLFLLYIPLKRPPGGKTADISEDGINLEFEKPNPWLPGRRWEHCRGR